MSNTQPRPPASLALVPGLVCDEALWRHQMDSLADRATIYVPAFREESSIGAMADRVLGAMPERFSLAGLSMGGYVALEIMRRAPERVERLALLNTRATQDTPEQRKRRLGLVELAQKGTFKGITPNLVKAFIAEAHHSNETLFNSVLAMTERVGRAAFLNQQQAILDRDDMRPGLSKISCRTIVIGGVSDVLTPPDEHRTIAAGIPTATLTILEDCGHLSPMEQPEKVTQMLRDWLKST